MEMFNPINCKAYLSALQGGHIAYPLAPTTSWRQTVTAADVYGTAAEVSVLASVDAIADGDFIYDFVDPAGDTVATITVTVGGGVPADEAGLAAAIVAAIEAEADLDDYLNSAADDGIEFVVVWNAGYALRMVTSSEPTASLAISHVSEINLNALNDRNTFPRYVTREADPFVLVTSAWPADATIAVANNGEVNSEVIVDAPIDVEGVVETASVSTLSATDFVEPAWDPVATFQLGDDPFPTDGALEVIVPFSPIIAPVRLP